VGFDSDKQIKGRKRFATVDTLGLVLPVFVSAASTPERAGAKQVLQRVQQQRKAVFRGLCSKVVYEEESGNLLI
jgi:hypothetical protein